MTIAKTYETSRFREFCLYLRWGSFALMTLAVVVSWFVGSRVVNRRLEIAPGASAQAGSLTLSPHQLGATRILAEARVPSNHWLTYELQVTDAQNNLLASAVKEAWSESGTWSEGGESGYWSESDLKGGLDFKVSETEAVNLNVAVLSYTTAGGQPVNRPVPIELEAFTWIPFRPPLYWGWIVVTFMTWLSGKALTVGNGNKVIEKQVKDSEVGDRAELGGPGQLVRLEIQVRSDRRTPPVLRFKLQIRDRNGETIYAQKDHMNPVIQASGGRQSRFEQYFYFKQRDSYGFYLEVGPDTPVDQTTISVFEQVRTKGAVTVTEI